MLDRIKYILISQWAYFMYGLILGALIILGIRFFTYQPADTHYHANFGVFINGERERFKGSQFYEEVAACGVHDAMTPKMRTHMHNEENGVVHVHDEAVTWGQFFTNLGWVIGPDFIRTTDTLYIDNEDNDLNIILNEQNLTGLTSLSNRLIEDKDRLLISYGTADESALDLQYATVPDNAEEYNTKPDPAGCAGTHDAPLSERLNNLF